MFEGLTEKQKNNLAFTNEFIGYGILSNAKIFFFGLEESEWFKNEEEFCKWKRDLDKFIFKNEPLYYSDKLNRYNSKPTDEMFGYLLFNVQKKYFDNYNDNYEEFKNDTKNFVGFFSNVFPVGAPEGSELPQYHKELFGFNTKTDYYNMSWAFSREAVLKLYLYYLSQRITVEQDILIFCSGYNSSNSAYGKLKPIF